MTRYKLGERVDDADDGHPELFVFHTIGSPQTSGSGHPTACHCNSASKVISHFLLLKFYLNLVYCYVQNRLNNLEYSYKNQYQ